MPTTSSSSIPLATTIATGHNRSVPARPPVSASPSSGSVAVSPPLPVEPAKCLGRADGAVPFGSHTGKIARLPRAVRDELNRRLDDGEKGDELLSWLNRQPATREAVKSQFGGHPITKQNLSQWRQGGFLDWQRQQDGLVLSSRLLEEADDVAALSNGSYLTDRLAGLAALSLARLLQSASLLPDGPDKTRAVLQATHELIRLRHSDWSADQSRRERKKWRRHDRFDVQNDAKNGQIPVAY